MDWVNFGIFFGLQLVNVILSTMRSILTVKASKNISAIITAISYTFYTAVVKLVTSQEMWTIIVVTFVTNIIGVYIANWVLEKFKKDKVWRITVTIPSQIDSGEITEKLNEYNISNVVYVGNGVKICDIYSKTQGESAIIKEILTNVKGIKYSIIEIEKSF